MISVIIPVYNNYRELSECLGSLENQVYKNFEVIVVDDGSTEPMGSEFSIFNFQFSINFYKIKHGGAARARNFGFEKSQGEFILFCDADMELRADCLRRMFEPLKNNQAKAYAYSDFKYGWKVFRLWDFDAGKLKKNNYISICSLLRREDFVQFDESLKRFQDWDLWLSLLEKGKTGVYIPEVLFKASTGSGTISQWLPKIFYKLSFLNLKRVKEYQAAQAIIFKKHGIN